MILCHLKLPRTRTVGFIHVVSARNVAVAKTQASVQLLSTATVKSPDFKVTTREELVKMSEEGLAKVKEEKRLKQERRHRRVSITLDEKLQECEEEALQTGAMTHTFTIPFSDSCPDTELHEILRQELSQRLPGVDVTLETYRANRRLIVGDTNKVYVKLNWEDNKTM